MPDEEIPVEPDVVVAVDLPDAPADETPEVVEGGDSTVIVEGAPDNPDPDVITRLTRVEDAVAVLSASLASVQETAENAQITADVAIITQEETAEAVVESAEVDPFTGTLEVPDEPTPDTPPASRGPSLLFASREDLRNRRESRR